MLVEESQATDSIPLPEVRPTALQQMFFYIVIFFF